MKCLILLLTIAGSSYAQEAGVYKVRDGYVRTTDDETHEVKEGIFLTRDSAVMTAQYIASLEAQNAELTKPPPAVPVTAWVGVSSVAVTVTIAVLTVLLSK